MQKLSSVFSIVSILFLASGCAVNRYGVQIGKFRDQAQKSTTVLADLYSTRNAYELDLYLLELSVNPKLKIQKTDANGKATPLGKPTFSPASIKARLDSLDLIGAYASELAKLANSQGPSQFKDAASLLGTNLAGLDKTFKSLQGDTDPTANKYIGPIGNLIGAIGEMILEQKREASIRKAVTSASPRVTEILKLLQDDLDTVFAPQISTGDNQRLGELTKAYNDALPTLTYEQRKQRLGEIKTAASMRSTDISGASSALITAMAAAHEALVKVAQKPRLKPQDFAEFITTLESWSNKLEYLAGQLKAITK